IPPQSEGHARAALQADGRPLYSGGGRNAQEPDAQAARPPEGLREGLERGNQSRIVRLLRPRARILRRRLAAPASPHPCIERPRPVTSWRHTRTKRLGLKASAG